ncbi:hypothetical protein BASA61_007201 [Batrachochytrium salamandrivorans]|nr:hypothetical protein BASA62_002133 [Batrachochytrium salamandrivorans]KAH6584833.1 hypothetical protein BASA61_007201 [Batrachochytrium salamandrivorans]KAH9272182.1 hypothetical protein BASA83_005522 [Batrachochytrium salamandrivorans]
MSKQLQLFHDRLERDLMHVPYVVTSRHHRHPQNDQPLDPIYSSGLVNAPLHGGRPHTGALYSGGKKYHVSRSLNSRADQMQESINKMVLGVAHSSLEVGDWSDRGRHPQEGYGHYPSNAVFSEQHCLRLHTPNIAAMQTRLLMATQPQHGRRHLNISAISKVSPRPSYQQQSGQAASDKSSPGSLLLHASPHLHVPNPHQRPFQCLSTHHPYSGLYPDTYNCTDLDMNVYPDLDDISSTCPDTDMNPEHGNGQSIPFQWPEPTSRHTSPTMSCTLDATSIQEHADHMEFGYSQGSRGRCNTVDTVASNDKQQAVLMVETAYLAAESHYAQMPTCSSEHMDSGIRFVNSRATMASIDE